MFNRFASALFVLALAGSASADLAESDFWKPEVEAGNLLPVAKRIPTSPKVVDLEGKDRLIGRQGGTLRTLVTRTKDVRQMVVYGYSRLVGYDENYEIKPDILLGLENEGNRKLPCACARGIAGPTAIPLRPKISAIGGKMWPTTLICRRRVRWSFCESRVNCPL